MGVVVEALVQMELKKPSAEVEEFSRLLCSCLNVRQNKKNKIIIIIRAKKKKMEIHFRRLTYLTLSSHYS